MKTGTVEAFHKKILLDKNVLKNLCTYFLNVWQTLSIGIIVLKLLDAVAFDQVDAVGGEETNGTNHRDDRIVRIDMLHRLVKVTDAFRHVWRI